MSIQFTKADAEALASFQLKQFRDMVNYESGKNKGYVRLSRDEKGKLVLDKFNNKVDVKLSLRANTGEVESRKLREAFLRAITSRMDNVASLSDIESISRMLMGAHGEFQAKPLSRREIRNVLAKYDELMNTASNRRIMINKKLEGFFDQAKSAGFKGTREEFLSKYMGLGKGANEDRFSAYYAEDVSVMDKAWKAKEAAKPKLDGPMSHDTTGAKKAHPMLKKEMEFLSMNSQLAQLGQAAILRISTETQLRGCIERIMKAEKLPDDPFSAPGMTELKGKIRNTIEPLLKARNIDTNLAVDGRTGSKPVMNMFMDRVLPMLFREAREQVAILKAANNGAEFDADAIISVDSLVADAEEFFAEAGRLRADLEAAAEKAEQEAKEKAALKAQVDVLVKQGMSPQEAEKQVRQEQAQKKAQSLPEVMPKQVQVQDLAQPQNPPQVAEGKQEVPENAAPTDPNKLSPEQVEKIKKEHEKTKGAFSDFVKNALGVVERQGVYVKMRDDFLHYVAAKKNDPTLAKLNLRQEIEKLQIDLGNDAAFEIMTHEFILRKCPSVNKADVEQPRSVTEMAMEHVDKVVLAGKLNYGERMVTKFYGKNFTGVDDKPTEAFASGVADAVVEVVNEYGRGGLQKMEEMFADIAETRLMTIVNSRISIALKKDSKERVHLGAHDVKATKPGLVATAKLYNAFNALATEMREKAYKAYEKVLNKEVKGQRISEEQKKHILDKVLSPLSISLVKEQRRLFLSKLPFNDITEAEIDEFVTERKNDVKSYIDAGIREALGEANAWLTVDLALNSKLPGNAKEEIRKQSAVNDFILQSGDIQVEMLRPGLERLYNEVAGEELKKASVGKKQLNDAEAKTTLANIQKTFKDRADVLVSGFKALRKEVEEFVRKSASELLLKRFSGEIDPHLYGEYKDRLTQQEKKDLANEIVNEAMDLLGDTITKAMKNAMLHPESYKKIDTLKQTVIDGVLNSASVDAMGPVAISVMQKRMQKVGAWIKERDNGENLFQDARRMGACKTLKAKFPNLPDGSFASVLQEETKQVMERIDKISLHYSRCKTLKDFADKVESEIVEKAIKPLQKLNEAYGKLLKKAPKLESRFPALGEEKIQHVRKTVAVEIHFIVPDLTKVTEKELTALYVQLLGEKVEATAEEHKALAEEFMVKMDEAMPIALKRKEAFVKAFKAKSAGLPQEAIDQFEKIILPKYEERLELLVSLEPESFLKSPPESQVSDSEVEGAAFANEARKLDFDDPANDMDLLEIARVPRKNMSTAAETRIHDAIRAYARTDDAKKFKIPAMIAQMDNLYTTHFEKKGLTDEQMAPVAIVTDEIRRTCLPFVTEFRVSDFVQGDNLEKAHAAFKEYLAGYNRTYSFPEDLICDGLTIENHAIAYFDKTVKKILEKLVQGRKVPEDEAAVLDKQFLVGLSNLFGTIGTKLAIQDVIANGAIKAYKEEFNKKPDLFDVEQLKNSGPDGKELYRIVSANGEAFHRHIQIAIEKTQKEVEALDIGSYESFARCQEEVGAIFRKHLNDGKDELVLMLNKRVEMERKITAYKMMSRQMMSDFKDSLRIELIDSGRFGQKLFKNRESFIAKLDQAFEDYVAAREKSVRKAAENRDDWGKLEALMKGCETAFEDFKLDLENIKKPTDFAELIVAYKAGISKEKISGFEDMGFGDIL